MEKKVYLEWFKDRRKCRFFWVNFRVVIYVNLVEIRETFEL